MVLVDMRVAVGPLARLTRLVADLAQSLDDATNGSYAKIDLVRANLVVRLCELCAYERVSR